VVSQVYYYPNLELPEVPSLINYRPTLPIEVDQVIRKALNKSPGLRQKSARQLFEDFSNALAPLEINSP